MSIETQIDRLLARDPALTNENANKDSRVIGTQRDLLAGVVSKEYSRTRLLPTDVADAHERGDIHVHDLDYSIGGYFNCCVPDIPRMLKSGFQLGGASIETPKSLRTAAEVIPQVVVNISSNQYGGITVHEVDKILEPYAFMSLDKHRKDARKWVSEDRVEEYAREHLIKEIYDACQSLEYELNSCYSSAGQVPFVTVSFGLAESWLGKEIQKAILEVRLKGLGRDGVTPVFPKLIYALREGHNKHPDDPFYDVKRLAVKCATKRIYPDILSYENVVALYGAFVTPMGCVRGYESALWEQNGTTYYTGLSSMWDKLSTHTLPKYQDNGVDQYIDLHDVTVLDSHTGKPVMVRATRIVKNHQNHWLKIKTLGGRVLHVTTDHPLYVKGRGRVTAMDLVPGDVLKKSLFDQYDVGAPVYGDKAWLAGVIITDGCLNDPCEILGALACAKKKRFDTVKNRRYDREDAEVVSVEYVDIDEPSYDLTTETDYFDVSGIVSHNCRSFVPYHEKEDGSPMVYGRRNGGVVTLNLPRQALKSETIDEFYANVLEESEHVRSALEWRIETLRGVHARNNPIFYSSGAAGSVLGADDQVIDIFTDGEATFSFGYTGLNETVSRFYGTDWYGDSEAVDFSMNIIRYLNQIRDRWNAESRFYYTLYATPAESLTDRFAHLDAKEFGVVEGVTDKDWYTNSFHVDPRHNMSPFDKYKFEAKYIPYTTGGNICYVEMPNLESNPDALEALWDYASREVPYFGVNTPISKCLVCSYSGDMDADARGFFCPECGNRDADQLEVIMRLCGYLSDVGQRKPIAGRVEEIKARVKHGALPVGE